MLTTKKIRNSLVIVLFVLWSFAFSTAAYAIGSYTINGVTVQYTNFSSSPNECWVYANKVYAKIWGVNFSNAFNSSDNMLRNLPDSQLLLNVENLRKYVSAAALGSCLRICNSEYLHGSDGWGHSQVIVQKDANGFAVLEGGLSNYPYCREKYYTWSEYCNTGWLGGTYRYIKYIKWPGAPAYTSTHDPEGCFDGISSPSMGTISLSGWSFDRDNLGAAISIHVYIGGPSSDPNAEKHCFTANKSRPDVPQVFPGVGNYHGFQETLKTSKRGTQTVYVYAINTGGGVNNPLLGSKTVTIKADDKAPTISNVKISQDATGYTVTCNVSDNIGVTRVQFPTWTAYNDQDDLDKSWWTSQQSRGTLSNGKVTFRVNKKSHNNENGLYLTDIYAFDADGNYGKSTLRVYLGAAMSVLGSMSYNGHTYYVINNPQLIKWQYCESYARVKGGHLAAISSAAENTAVCNLLKRAGVNKAYLGGRDTGREGAWEWASGEKWSYTNWSPGNPDNCYANDAEEGYGQNFLAMYNNGYWDDTWRNPVYDPATTAFVIEIPKTAVSTAPVTAAKKTQAITASSVIKTFGDKAFNLGAKAQGKLTYKTSNSKIATINASGKVTIRGVGIATITINAASTSTYKAATKQITITVYPKTVAQISGSNNKKGKLTIKWKKGTDISGYRIQVATNASFAGAKTYTVNKAGTTTKTISVKKGKTYWVRIQTYKGSIKSSWRTAKKIKIKK